ncbi:MAG: GGDEF domain-containing protein [Proteobacteria bacterium]|nr:GGDEF domain-containing protein [Pseudomonadota bacterium]
MSEPPTLDALLLQAEAARADGRLPEGLAAAEQAWPLSTDAPPAQRLRAGLLLLYFRYRAGALNTVVDTGLQLLPLLREAPALDVQLDETLRMLVLSATDVGRFEEALAFGHEVHQRALHDGDSVRLSLATNALGCVYERMGDPWHGERLMLDGLALARQQRHPHAMLVALNNLIATLSGAHYLLQGSVPPDQAAQVLLRALPYAAEAMQIATVRGEPYPLALVQGNRGELLTLLGRLDEAWPDLAAAAELARRHGFDALAWRIACSTGEHHLRSGAPEAAWQLLQQTLQASAAAAAEARMTRLRLHHAAYRAARALGRPHQALEQLEQYQHLERARLLSQLRGRSQLFVTTVEAEQVRLEARRAGERAARAEVSARIDQLTGLGNRRELEQRWTPLVQRLQDEQRPLALAMLDLDHFKQVNDRFGHAVGDHVLVALAGLLRDNMRGDDLIIRTGGEEFLLVLPEADRDAALHICDRMRQRVAAHDWGRLHAGLTVSVSVGVAAAPPYELRALIVRADVALYEAKRAGRDCVRAG